MTQIHDFFRSERYLFSAELVGLFDFDFLYGSRCIVGYLRGRASSDLRFLAFEPDVTATVRFLTLEYDVSLYRNFEAGTDLKWDSGEKSPSCNGL